MMRHKVSVVEGYKRWAPEYDTYANPMVAMVEHVFDDIVGEADGQRVLELGCGTGRNLERLQEMGASGVGVDVSPDMLEVCRGKLDPDKFTLREADLTKPLGLKEGLFDLILCSLVLEHIEDFGPLFQSVSDMLGDEGRFILFEIHPFLRLKGSKAHYKDSTGYDHELPSFPHLISDFVSEATNNGMALSKMKEFYGELDTPDIRAMESKYGYVPLLLSMTFGKA
jgi:malonyl-CoA O-methyltransferase